MKNIYLLFIMTSLFYLIPHNSIAKYEKMNLKQERGAVKTAEQDTTAGKDSANIVYTCSMHPEIISAVAGYCPKCGMQLVKKTDNGNTKGEMKTMKMGMKGMGIIMLGMMVVMLVFVGRH